MRIIPLLVFLCCVSLAQLSGEMASPAKSQPSMATNDDLWNAQAKDWSHAASYDMANGPPASSTTEAEANSAKGMPVAAEASNQKAESPSPTPASAPTTAVAEDAPLEDYTNVASDDQGASPGIKGIHKSTSDDTFSLDFADEPIRNVIRYIADVYSLNVVIPESLSGNVSLKLKDVNWPEVFQAVLDPAGFSYIQEGTIIKIKSIEDVKSEPMQTRIFPLKFSDANAVLGSISPLVDPALGGRILADSRTNVLIITERPTRLRELDTVVSRLDEAESQVMIETKIAEIKRTNKENRGIDWSVMNGYAMSIGNPAGVPVADYPAGINRTFIPKDSTYERGETIIFNASQFKLLLNALDTDNHVDLVASPNVVTMNNTKANINIARRVPVPNYSYNQQTGTFEVSGFNYENIGVILDVTPKAQQNFITLDIRPELSDSSENVQFGGDNSASKAQIPIINTRRTQSIVTIESGYTLALGGLMKEGDNEITSKLPLIGNLPGPIGKLFSSTSKTKEKTNLIIFVTATRIGFNGEPYVPFKGNIPNNMNLKTLDDILYTERDMPGADLSPDEKKALDAARALRKQQDETLYKQRLEAKMLKMQKDQPQQEAMPQEKHVEMKQAEPKAPEAMSEEPKMDESSPVKPIKKDLQASRI